MCTVSWIQYEDGYQLFCNRDEKRTRLPAAGPQPGSRNGVRFLAPVDMERGGTWIAANELGVVVCLLNGSGVLRTREFRSRGEIVMNVAGARSAESVYAEVRRMDLTAYAPFSVVALESGAPAQIVHWNGENLRTADGICSPLVSSSYDPEGVRLRRHIQFERMMRTGAKPANMQSFHESHGNGPDAYSPCMHRPDAETVSFSRVTVTSTDVRFSYSPGAPCLRLPYETRRLNRS